MLNNRAIEIVKDLIDYEEVSIKELAQKFKITTRTIYYDLENINYFLNKNGFQGSIKNGKKIFFNLEEKEGIKILAGNGSIFSPNERKEYLITKLFFEGIIKLNSETKNLEVTRKTLENDIKEIKKDLNEFEMDLISLPGKGITFRRKEQMIRGYFVRYLVKIFTQKHNLKPLVSDYIDEICKIFPVKKLEELTKYMLKKHNVRASIFEYYSLVSIMITELIMKKNGLIFINENKFISQIEFSKEEIEKMEEDIENFGFDFSLYTKRLILYKIKIKDENLQENQMDMFLLEAYKKTMNFIEEFKKHYPHDFWSEKIKKALLTRFQTSQFKYKFNFQETLGVQNDFPKRLNPLCEKVKSISKKYFGELLEEDLKRITYVIADFINQYEEKIKLPKKVVIVHYNLGITLERDIAKHLSFLWNLEVLKIIPGYHLEDFLEENKEKIDGVITFESGYLRSIKTDIPVIPLNLFELEGSSEALADYGFNKKVKY